MREGLTTKEMRVAIDAMGGDNAPDCTVNGSVLALKEWRELKVILTGPKDVVEETLERALQKLSSPSEREEIRSRIEIVHTDQYIRMDDPPSLALKDKRDNSLVKSLSLLKSGEVDAVVYAGNTGALLEASVLTLGRLPNVKRPALITLWPVKEGGLAFLDSGANAEAKPDHLNQFAIMGTVFYQVINGYPSPRVGLLNIGSEEVKGSQLQQEAYKMLRSNELINFIGNVEPEDLFSGKVDVVVADGFTGNMVLKTAEATINFLVSQLRDIAKKSVRATLGGLLLKPYLRDLKKELDYAHLGGALLIGLNYLCIKTHGKADEIAIKNAIGFSRRLHEQSIIEKLKEQLAKLNNSKNGERKELKPAR